MTKFVALLPMKAISERVANKNIKLLDGKPLFYYIADSIKASGAFDHICINTDGSDIADLAKSRYQSFVTINPRPSHLCGNDVPMNSIIEFDIPIFNISFYTTTRYITFDSTITSIQLFMIIN